METDELRKIQRMVLRREPISNALTRMVDGLTIQHVETTKRPGSIQSSWPISYYGYNYFEIFIVDASSKGNISLGLAEDAYPLNSHVGVEKKSYGYHSSNGNSFKNCGNSAAFGPSYSANDIVGCGILDDDKVYFTKNGKFIGVAFTGVTSESLYPTVALSYGNDRVIVNLGNLPFKYASSVAARGSASPEPGLDLRKRRMSSSSTTLIAPSVPSLDSKSPGKSGSRKFSFGNGKSDGLAISGMKVENEKNNNTGGKEATKAIVMEPYLMLRQYARDVRLKAGHVRNLKVMRDELTLRYTASLAAGPASIQATNVVNSKTYENCYYEVTIVACGAECSLVIGYAERVFAPSKVPGTDGKSYGYRVLDGHKLGSGRHEPFGPKANQGDIVGCGFNTDKKTIYFTHNGRHLGTAFTDVTGSYQPTISLSTPGETMYFNFGMLHFLYDSIGTWVDDPGRAQDDGSRHSPIRHEPSPARLEAPKDVGSPSEKKNRTVGGVENSGAPVKRHQKSASLASLSKHEKHGSLGSQGQSAGDVRHEKRSSRGSFVNVQSLYPDSKIEAIAEPDKITTDPASDRSVRDRKLPTPRQTPRKTPRDSEADVLLQTPSPVVNPTLSYEGSVIERPAQFNNTNNYLVPKEYTESDGTINYAKMHLKEIRRASVDSRKSSVESARDAAILKRLSSPRRSIAAEKGEVLQSMIGRDNLPSPRSLGLSGLLKTTQNTEKPRDYQPGNSVYATPRDPPNRASSVSQSQFSDPSSNNASNNASQAASLAASRVGSPRRSPRNLAPIRNDKQESGESEGNGDAVGPLKHYKTEVMFMDKHGRRGSVSALAPDELKKAAQEWYTQVIAPRPVKQMSAFSPRSNQSSHEMDDRTISRSDCGEEGESVSSSPLESDMNLKWQKGDLIGRGAYGKVHMGLNVETGEIFAVKSLKVESVVGNMERIRAIQKEILMLKSFHHRNIVRYIGTDYAEDHLLIFLEYVPGGSITDMIKKFGALQESVVALYTKQVLEGLKYLHSNRVVHRDIKGANVLVDNNGVVKLADFGASLTIDDQMAVIGATTEKDEDDNGVKSIQGTPYWMAPEVISETGHGRKSDIWSLGATVLEMLAGKPPWSHLKNSFAVMFQIVNSTRTPAYPDHISDDARSFLDSCFRKDPRERPTAEQLSHHPFVEQVAAPSRQMTPRSGGNSQNASHSPTARSGGENSRQRN